jgi:hypothetical protein
MTTMAISRSLRPFHILDEAVYATPKKKKKKEHPLKVTLNKPVNPRFMSELSCFPIGAIKRGIGIPKYILSSAYVLNERNGRQI